MPAVKGRGGVYPPPFANADGPPPSAEGGKGSSAPAGAGRGLSNRPLHPFGPLTFEFECGESKIQTPKIVRRMHFNNVNKERHYEYGEQYDSSELVFNMISDEIRNAYNPFESCASAQMLIKKERKK